MRPCLSPPWPLLSVANVVLAQQPAKTLRAGMIGLDTSHVPAFARIFNNPEAAGDWPASRSSPAIPAAPTSPPAATASRSSPSSSARWASRSSIRFRKLLEKVDVVLLESVDGRIHLQEAIRGDQGGQAAVHRQAGGRLAGRRDRDLRAGEEAQRAGLLQLVGPLQRGPRRGAEGRGGRPDRSARRPGARARTRRARPTCSSTASTASSRCSRSWDRAARRSAACRPKNADVVDGRLEGRPRRHLSRHSPRQGHLRRDRLRHQRHRRSRQGGGGYETCAGDRPVLQDGQAAGERRRDDRDLHLHGSRRRKQAARRRSRFRWPTCWRKPKPKPPSKLAKQIKSCKPRYRHPIVTYPSGSLPCPTSPAASFWKTRCSPPPRPRLPLRPAPLAAGCKTPRERQRQDHRGHHRLRHPRQAARAASWPAWPTATSPTSAIPTRDRTARSRGDPRQSRNARAPKAVQDLRKVLDDKSVDAVFICTCNHWHALAAIWAMQAGKDAYVEKPVSHNVSEGRRMVQVPAKTGRICQGGTQYRSQRRRTPPPSSTCGRASSAK